MAKEDIVPYISSYIRTTVTFNDVHARNGQALHRDIDQRASDTWAIATHLVAIHEHPNLKEENKGRGLKRGYEERPGVGTS